MLDLHHIPLIINNYYNICSLYLNKLIFSFVMFSNIVEAMQA